MQAIIDSYLDTDLYKFTMMQCVWHHFKGSQALYRFECRNHKQTKHLKEKVQEQVQALKEVRWKNGELDYLSQLSYMKPDFIEYLKGVGFNPDYVKVNTHLEELTIEIEGPWLETILFEVPLLAMVSELYGETLKTKDTLNEANRRLTEKIETLKKIKNPQFGFTDFGTRRRFSKAWQDMLTQRLIDEVPEHFHATSNIGFAAQYGIPVLGTMAHEFIQACQVLAPNLHESQKFALNTWYQEYQGQLGIALTDTITFEVFLREFDKPLALKYQGLRQDSGDPIAWGERALKFYQDIGVSAKDKTFVFSDKLTVQKAYEIFQLFEKEVRPTFGIGTNLTNDVGILPPDIVIKLNRMNGKPVVKISDSVGKEICDDQVYLSEFKKRLGIQVI